jgi:hypothetical protein
VKQIYRSGGKPQAMKYVNQMAGRICQRQGEKAMRFSLARPQIELE